MKNKNLYIILISTSALLAIPFLAMQFTKEVNWDMMDFIIAGVFIFSFGLVINLLLKILKNSKYKIIFILIFIFAFVLLWAEMAVGIFGSPIAGN